MVPFGCRSVRRARTKKAFLIYKMAIELDPEFAIAYARLGGVH
jgi:hypothetical protein